MEDESLSAIHFCTTPKGDLPHYSYIFRNMEPLGKYIKKIYCSRLGNVLYLDIQKGKKALKTEQFQQEV